MEFELTPQYGRDYVLSLVMLPVLLSLVLFVKALEQGRLVLVVPTALILVLAGWFARKMLRGRGTVKLRIDGTETDLAGERGHVRVSSRHGSFTYPGVAFTLRGTRYTVISTSADGAASARPRLRGPVYTLPPVQYAQLTEKLRLI